MLVVPVLKEEEVAVPLGFQQDPVAARRPLAQLFIDLGQNAAALGIGAGLHQILVVVHHQKGQHGPGGSVGLPQGVGLGDVHPVGSGDQVLLSAAAFGPHQAAVDPEAAAVHHDAVRTFLLPLQQPLDGAVRHRVLHPHLKEVFPYPGQLEEVLVAPNDLPGVRAKDHCGQGGVNERGFAGGVHAAGDIVDVLQDSLAALFVHLGEVRIQRCCDAGLRQGQQGIHRQGQQAEQGHTEEVQL